MASREKKLQEDNEEIRRELLNALEQVSSYWILEDDMATSMSDNSLASKHKVKIIYRNRVESKGYTRPTMTKLEAISKIIKYEKL